MSESKQGPQDNLPPSDRLIVPEQDILNAVVEYTLFDDREDARSIYDEAQRGNAVAQYIVGMSLVTAGYRGIGEAWLKLSAQQGFRPAEEKLRKAS